MDLGTSPGFGTTPSLSDGAFEEIRRRIYALAGIQLGDQKRLMVQGRLNKRLRDTGTDSYEAYLSLLDRSGRGSDEESRFINALTTNKTDFFREAHHFEYLSERVFPALIERSRTGAPKRLRIWCAASSTGEEPWSLAMTVAETFTGLPGWDVKILASDIDTEVLHTAARGVYADERMEGVSEARRTRFFQRGTGAAAGWWRVKDSLKSLVDFRRVNLVSDRWDVPDGLDVVFCRNVIIYFDRPTQTRLFSRIADLMAPHAWLFAGHSESLLGVTNRLISIGNTIYVNDPDAAPTIEAPTPAPRARPAQTPAHHPRHPHAQVRPDPHPAPVREFSDGLPLHRIIVGQIHADNRPCRITTVLGSCVAACLWDPVAQVGGMNHFLLPDGGGGEDSARYGVHAMELLINKIMNLGGDRLRLRAKVLGAGRVTAVNSNVSERNAAFIRNFLAEERIVSDGERLLGERALEVHFFPHSGQVLVREVGANAVRDMEERAARLARSLAHVPKAAVTLF